MLNSPSFGLWEPFSLISGFLFLTDLSTHSPFSSPLRIISLSFIHFIFYTPVYPFWLFIPTICIRMTSFFPPCGSVCDFWNFPQVPVQLDIWKQDSSPYIANPRFLFKQASLPNSFALKSVTTFHIFTPALELSFSALHSPCPKTCFQSSF